MSTAPPEGAVARAARALRIALLVCAGACVALGLMGAGLALLTRDDAALWPGLTLLGVGQLAGLAGATVAGLGLRRVLTGSAPRDVTPRVRATLGRLGTVLGAVLVTGAAAWILARPSAWVAVLACALVSAQLVAVLRFLRR
ncbi:hypothetical protein KZX45_04345 [Georgenia sp. EYE_87]|uniref:hypothetical protein n=1 Tax=Georgenia sp. EYE_87 TaxID=2853448 RepID=UPI002002A0F1|nr:hypothetical protein [Georgenia sp. EYE_87]MCK6209769.1 hypothetical protein [Georgenia sp. EYE_87]